MLPPKGDFWIDRYRRQAGYERATFAATVTHVWSDAVYDVQVTATGARFYDVNNGTPYNFVVGDMVIVTRPGGGRGNRHVIIAPAGRGATGLPAGGTGGGGIGGDPVTLGEGSDAALTLSGQELTLADVLTPTEHTAIGDAAPHHTEVHNVLSTKHGDAVTASITKGDLLYGNATPKVDRLALGVGSDILGIKAGQVLWRKSDAYLCETMLDRLLRGMLNPGSNQDITYVESNAATADIAVVQTWNGSWTNAATYRWIIATHGGGDKYFEIVFTGSQIVLWSQTGHGTYSPAGGYASIAVKIDGAPHGTWDQATAASYSITGLSYGVHTLRCTATDLIDEDNELRIGHIIPREYAYAGVGVQNDAIETSYVYPRLVVTSIGRGPTAGAGGYPSTIFGQSIVHRCPLPTDMATDYLVTRAALEVVGYTALSRGFIAIPGLWHILHGSASGWPRAGLTLTLGAAAIRGRRGSANIYGGTYTNYLTASTNHLDITCGMGRVTAIGAGSVLAVNQLVFWVQTYGRSAAATTPTSAWQGGTPEGCDFFVIPSDLL
jgi:hypothetical protein